MVLLFRTHDVMITITNGDDEEVVGFNTIEHDNYVITLEEAENLLKQLEEAIKRLKKG